MDAGREESSATAVGRKQPGNELMGRVASEHGGPEVLTHLEQANMRHKYANDSPANLFYTHQARRECASNFRTAPEVWIRGGAGGRWPRSGSYKQSFDLVIDVAVAMKMFSIFLWIYSLFRKIFKTQIFFKSV